MCGPNRSLIRGEFSRDALFSISMMMFILFMAIDASAVQSPNLLSLSVDDAVRLAIEHNESIMIAREQERKASGTVREAYAGALPKINVSASYQGNFLKPAFFLEGDKIEIGNDVEMMGNVRLDQVLYAFGRVGKAVDYAQIYRKTASLGIDLAENAVVVSVKEAYYRVLLLEQLFEIQQTSLDQARSHLANIDLKHRAGAASRFELQRAMVEVKNREPELIRAENNIQLAIQDLERIIGLPHENQLILLDTLTFRQLSIQQEDAVAEGLLYRPEIRSMMLNVEGRKKVLGIYKADIFPILSLFGQVTVQGQASKGNALKVLDPENRQISGSAGIGLSAPLFDGFKTKGKVEQARADLRAAEHALQQTRKGIRLEIIRTVQDIESLIREYDAQEATVELANDAYGIAGTRFENGISTLLELNDAQLALDLAKMSRAETLYRYDVALANLDHALGRAPYDLVLENPSTVPPVEQEEVDDQ